MPYRLYSLQSVCRLSLALLLCVSHWCAAQAEPMVVRYHITPGTEKHTRYQFDLVERALEVTRAEFGDYRVEPYTEAPTAMRQALLLSEGRAMNMQWASPGTPIAKADVLTVPVDILQGLLGYRVCIVNKARLPAFAQVQRLQDLQQFKIGQGIGWADMLIYQHNQVPVLGASKLNYLFPMLASERFDCLALGVNEVAIKFAEEQQAYPALVIEPSLLIYYEFPIYIYVSKKTPLLAQRLELGLARLQASGEFNQRLQDYFGAHISQLKLNERHIVCLHSPYLADQAQCLAPVQLPALLTAQPTAEGVSSALVGAP